MAGTSEVIQVAGREVTITNPDKVFFAGLGVTKIELVNYYLAVAEGALRGAGGRPMALKRFVNGAEGQFFFQKRAPESRPDWIETVELSFPSGRTASEVVVRDAAQLAWIINLGCIDLNPHPIRADDLDHPTSCGSISTRSPESNGPRSATWPWSCANRSRRPAWSAGPRHPGRGAST